MESYLTEACQALISAMAVRDQLPASLVPNEGLIDTIEKLEMEINSLKSELSSLKVELEKYKSAYTKVKVDRDNSRSNEVRLNNQVAQLQPYVDKVKELTSQLQASQRRVQELEPLRKQVNFESIYQDLKALTGARGNVWKSTSPKLIEIRISTSGPNGTGYNTYFGYTRVNSSNSKPKFISAT